MTTVAECELSVDYGATAKLMTEAFGGREAIPPARLEWLYNRAFSAGATVVALREGRRKVGQIAMVRQTLLLNGQRESAAQLVDLFILPDYRGGQALKLLYQEVERQFIEQKIRFAIGMPNVRAFGVNAYFFHLQPYLTLSVNLGISLSKPVSVDGISLPFDPGDRDRIMPLLSHFRSEGADSGLAWDATMLFNRLSRPDRKYGLHQFGNLLLISTSGQSRGIPHTLLSGFFVRPGCRATQAEIVDAVRAACLMWKRRLFAYVGVNAKLSGAPGLVLPRKLRPSPMTVQLRDFEPDKTPLKFDRYELIDFDYA